MTICFLEDVFKWLEVAGPFFAKLLVQRVAIQVEPSRLDIRDNPEP